jgi:hypothetical protein
MIKISKRIADPVGNGGICINHNAVYYYSSVRELAERRGFPFYYLRKLGLPCKYKGWTIEFVI